MCPKGGASEARLRFRSAAGPISETPMLLASTSWGLLRQGIPPLLHTVVRSLTALSWIITTRASSARTAAEPELDLGDCCSSCARQSVSSSSAAQPYLRPLRRSGRTLEVQISSAESLCAAGRLHPSSGRESAVLWSPVTSVVSNRRELAQMLSFTSFIHIYHLYDNLKPGTIGATDSAVHVTYATLLLL